MDERRFPKTQSYMNDFICKQMDYFSETSVPQGYSEKIFIKMINPRRIVIELNMVKLDDDS